MAEYNLPQDIVDLIRNLKDRVERLERAPRAVATSIDSGEFTVTDPDSGNTVMRIGLQTHGDTGVSIYREDGTGAMIIAKPFAPTDTQIMRLANRGAEVIGGDQVLTNTGAAVPNQLCVTKTSLDTGVAVTSGTFVDIYNVHGHHVSSRYHCLFTAICSDGSTSGELRMVTEAGVQLAGFFGAVVNPTAIPIGTTTETEFEYSNTATDVFIARALGAAVDFRVQARRTAGVGTVTVKVKTVRSLSF